MRRQLAAGLSTAALVLGAAGCGGDDGDGQDTGGSDDEKKAVAALVDGMTTAESTESVREQNRCMAERLVDTMGVDGLQEAGLITEDYTAKLSDKLDVDTATVIADQVVACWDVEAQVEDFKPSYPQATPAHWSAYVACMEKLVPLVREYAIASYTQSRDTSAQTRLADRTQRCIAPLGKAVTPAG